MLEVEFSLVKIFFLSFSLALTLSCSSSDSEMKTASAPLRILLEPPPANLNPRASLDATSQRINELLFRALTRLDTHLVSQPDLAENWVIQDSGKTWRFKIRKDLKDHSGEPIGPSQIKECLENYRIGTPTSAFRTALPYWSATESDRDSITIRLNSPDPYLPRNLSLLRYFRSSDSKIPCAEPGPHSSVIGSGLFKAEKWDFSPQSQFTLIPIHSDQRKIDFIFIQDENTKTIRLLRGEIDAAHLALSLSKTRWLEQTSPDRFQVLTKEGVGVSYLAFNFRDPLLSQKEVRKAIALSIDRETIVHHKHLGFTRLAGSILSPLLPESLSSHFDYDPAQAEKLLDQAGLPRSKSGIRFTLHYKSTPVREGIETALMLQELLQKVGIQIIIDVVEPAVFISSIKKGRFQLFSSRWVSVADGSILYNSLHSGQQLNRIGYHDDEVDRTLDSAIGTTDATQRIFLMREIQKKIADDLPYFPLWYWDVGILLRKDLWLRNRDSFSADSLSLSGSLEPLTHLR